MDEWPSSSEMHGDKNFSRMMTLNSQNQTHIAQQFRREKLRIPDLQAPVSPQRDDASNHTSGSKSMGLPHRPPEPKRVKTGTGLNFPSGFENCSDGIIVQNAMGDVCQVYSTDAISLDPLNFPAGAELFPVSATKWMPTLPLAASAYNSNTNSLYSSDISSNLKRSSNPSYWGLGLHGQIPQQSNDAFFVGMGSSNLQNALNNDRQASYPAAVEAILVGTNLQSTGMVHKNKGMLMEPYLANLNNQPGTLQLCDVNLGFHVYPEALQGNVVLLGRESGGATNNRQAVSSHESYVPGIQLPYQSSMAPIPIVEQGLATSLLPSHLETQTSNNWPNGANELLFLPMPGNADSNNRTEMTLTNQTYNFGHQSPWTFPEYGMKHPMMIPGQDHTFIQGAMAQNLHLERSEDANLGHLQGLSLSLSSQHPSAMQGNSYHVDLPDTEFGNKCLLPHTREEGIVKIAEEISNRLQVGLNPLLASRDSLLASDLQNEDRKATANIKPFSYDHDLSTLSNFRMLSSSKYSRVVQHLLDEVCSVGKDGNSSGSTDNKLHDGMVFKSSPYGTIQSDKPEYDPAKKDVANFVDKNCSVSSVSQSAEAASALTQEERQHLQIKKTQLLAMLQEVDRQYRQYYDHMQAVVFSFDSAVGQVGAARPYTRSALKAMSRHFRCLRDTISNQIQMSCKALGEDGFSDPGPLRKVSSRLRFVDQQLRQQRALQQLGMLQQPAWRPQRGLPEHSVSILRAWLFEHFLHPYPKDADKMMLARQTGLSRSQVSNWFINARVRLWKPMVEEMYLEENKEHEHEACAKRVYNQTGDGISCEQNISENRDQNNAIVELNETMHNHEDPEFDAKVLAQGPRHQSSLDMRKTESDIFLRRITPTEMAHADEQDVNSGSKSGALEGEMNDEIITNNLLRQSIHQNYNPGSLDSSVFEKNMQIRPKLVNSDTFYRDDYKIVNLKGYSTNPCTVQNENMFMHHAATCDSYAINDGNLNLYTHMDVPPKLFGRGGVSLTLGLQQHADNLSQATSHDYINSTNNPTESHNVDGFHLEVINHTAGIHPDHLEGHETLNFQSKKRVPNQLLHEFVA